jgi:hypothetical protein
MVTLVWTYLIGMWLMHAACLYVSGFPRDKFDVVAYILIALFWPWTLILMVREAIK